MQYHHIATWRIIFMFWFSLFWKWGLQLSTCSLYWLTYPCRLFIPFVIASLFLWINLFLLKRAFNWWSLFFTILFFCPSFNEEKRYCDFNKTEECSYVLNTAYCYYVLWQKKMGTCLDHSQIQALFCCWMS